MNRLKEARCVGARAHLCITEIQPAHVWRGPAAARPVVGAAPRVGGGGGVAGLRLRVLRSDGCGGYRRTGALWCVRDCWKP
ncbi:hypothetical protein ACWC5I_19770, partial [Kitasatospora sp. NPDC001574]